MINIVGNLMVIKRTKKFNISRIENEIYSFLNGMSNYEGTFKMLNLTGEELEELKMRSDRMYIDINTSVDNWFKQYTLLELTQILDKYRVTLNNKLMIFDTEHKWFICKLISVIRDMKLQELGL